MKRSNSAASACKLSAVPKRVTTIRSNPVFQIPVVPMKVSRPHAIESQLRMRMGHIDPEKVRSNIRHISPEVDVDVGHENCMAETDIVDFKMMENPELKRLEPPSADVEVNELRAGEVDVGSYSHILRSSIDVRSHASLRYVYNKPFKLRSTIPQLLSRVELVVFWKELLKKVPTRMGADLELVGIFQGIEVDRFKSIKYDERHNELHLLPWPLSHQSPEPRNRYDIIYGRFIPNGKILSAAMESD